MTFETKDPYTAYDLYYYAKNTIKGKLPEHLHRQMLLFSFQQKEIIIPKDIRPSPVFLAMYNDNNFWVEEYKKFLKEKV